MAEPFLLYKLTILYMLEKAGFPLTNTQITDFILLRDYTDYFGVQEAISELLDGGLIEAETVHSNIQYSISESGRSTLGYFRYKITPGIRQDVEDFFLQKRWELQMENSVVANYRYNSNCTYTVNCQVRSDDVPVIDLALTVPNEEQANLICRNWKKNNEEAYALLMDLLMK